MEEKICKFCGDKLTKKEIDTSWGELICTTCLNLKIEEENRKNKEDMQKKDGLDNLYDY